MPPPPLPPMKCPRCKRALADQPKLHAGGFGVCQHCLGFLQFVSSGPRSLLPGDLDAVPEETRWLLLRARAELRPT